MVESQRTATPQFVIRDAEDDDGREGNQDNVQTIDGFTVIESAEPSSSVEDRVNVRQPPPRTRRCSICGATDHTARTCTADSMNVGTRASKRPAKDAIGMLAPSIVGTLNFCVVTSFGQECALTPLEANFLIPSMQRMLERMPAAAAQRAGIIIDPLVIVTVLIMWARRIGQVQDQKAKEKYVIRPEEQARANGVAGTVHSVDANAARQQSAPIPQPYPTSAEPPPPSASGIPPEILGSFDNATF